MNISKKIHLKKFQVLSSMYINNLKHETSNMKFFASGCKIKITCCFLCFFINCVTSFSQVNKESTPVFVLQGTVKLNGKPIEGVSLGLTKDKKPLTRMITRKNGLYSFQMNRNYTHSDTEYLINIVKEGAIAGVLRVNTFTLQGKSDYIPYVFNLEINLMPIDSSEITGKQNFGKIKWDPDRAVFDFDKEYAKTINNDKDSLITDSGKFLAAVIEKTEKEKENKEAEILKQTSDSLPIQLVKNEEKEQLSPEKEKLNEVSRTIKDSTLINKKEVAANKKIETSPEDNKQYVKTELKTEISPVKANEFQKENDALTKKKEELAKVETKGKILTSDNLKKSRLVSDISNQEEKKGADKVKKEIFADVSPKTADKQQTGTAKNKQFSQNAGVIQPDKQKASSFSADFNQQAFNGSRVFTVNADKNHLLKEKEKMERKKAFNLAKKYETSNILTSLLDVVEEQD